MNITHYVAQYDYAALVTGGLAGGETTTLLDGVVVYQGVLKSPLVALSVTLGGIINDQLLYLLGYRFGGEILRRFSCHQAKIHYAQRMIQRRSYLFVVDMRSMYGSRVTDPLLISASHLPPKVFLPLNIPGAFVWALLFITLGYVGGEMIALWLHSLDQHIKHGIWLVLVIRIIVGVRWWMKRRSMRKAQ